MAAAFPSLRSGRQSVGEAIGHIETVPLTLSLPVKVATDARVNASSTFLPI